MEVKKAQQLAAKISQLVNASQFPNMAKIEHDLLLQHIRDLYEELSTEASTAVEQKPSLEKQAEQPLIRRTFRANDNLLLNDVPPVKEEVKTITGLKQEIKQPVKEIVQEVKQVASTVVTPVKEVVHTAEVTVSKPATTPAPSAKVQTSINESIHAATGSLNERIKTSGKEIHKVIASKHLKDMIDLNNRFVFVSELFKGNKDEFNFAVNHIDEIADYTSAEGFIRSQLINTHKWDENSASVKHFMELVRYKFGIE